MKLYEFETLLTEATCTSCKDKLLRGQEAWIDDLGEEVFCSDLCYAQWYGTDRRKDQ